MLSRAVDAQKSAPVQKSTAKTPISLAKQLFPSSSPSIEDAFNGVPRSSYSFSQSAGKKGASVVSALRPTAPTTLNGASTTRHNGMSNKSLKRTLSQSLGLPTNKDSFGDKPLVQGSSAALYNSTLTSLHDAVYFDENDFDDDDDLDFNSPIVPNSIPQPPSQAPGPVADAVLDSDQQLPWSSSPLEHKLPPRKADILERAATDGFQSIAPPRRKLPWVEADKDIGSAQIKPTDRSRAARASRVAALQQLRKSNAEARAHGNRQITPLHKDNARAADETYAWNKTQSAVKEEQKRLRQTNKVLMKTNEATEEGKAIAIADKKKKNTAQVFLSEEQRRVQELVVDKGKSVFFTGSAGTGKSVLLRSIISTLRQKYKNETDRVAVTASTGLAACNIGGVTLHSFGGIGLGKEAIPDLVKKIRRNPKARNRWMRTKVLIIDEISMVDADLFDKLEEIARNIRNNGRPFGGIQLVITGDYFQLPPVPDYGKIAKFAFEAAAWLTCLEHKVSLTQVFRQKDPVFAQILNEMRLGKMSPASVNTFKQLSRPVQYNDGLEATELFPTRQEVDNANIVRMRNLPGQSVIFTAFDCGAVTDKTQRDKLLSNCMAPQSIELKVGSQVMLIKNMDDSLVNGSLGKVVDFMDEKTFDIYHQDEDEYHAVKDMPSDDESMDRSRKKFKAMLSKSQAADTVRRWPLVRFAVADGTSRELLCQPETWKIELPNGDIQAQRQQVPLILAWALSIHKAQGQTLERVKVDLGRVFEKGQAYVALSRATCQEGLQVLRFDPAKVMAHEKVRNFYSKLDTVKPPKTAVVVEEDRCYDDDEEEALQAMAC